MDGLNLIMKARQRGLRLSTRGNLLVIRGPRSAEPLAKELLTNKAAVLAVLKFVPEELPPDWHFLWDERAAIREFDGDNLVRLLNTMPSKKSFRR